MFSKYSIANLHQVDVRHIVLTLVYCRYSAFIHTFNKKTQPKFDRLIEMVYLEVLVLSRMGCVDERQIMLATLTLIKRAGADIILNYHAAEVARWLA